MKPRCILWTGCFNTCVVFICFFSALIPVLLFFCRFNTCVTTIFFVICPEKEFWKRHCRFEEYCSSVCLSHLYIMMMDWWWCTDVCGWFTRFTRITRFANFTRLARITRFTRINRLKGPFESLTFFVLQEWLTLYKTTISPSLVLTFSMAPSYKG